MPTNYKNDYGLSQTVWDSMSPMAKEAYLREMSQKPKPQPKPPSSSPKGDSSVLTLQQQLKAAGFDPGPLDGIMGPRTKAAQEAYNKAQAAKTQPAPATPSVPAPQTTAPQTPAAPAPVVEPKPVAEEPPQPNYQDLINQMIQAQRQSRISALQKSRDAALKNLAEQEAGIKPRYYDMRNQAAAQSDIGALNFAQYMAGRGIKGNAGGMPEIYRNAALQSNIGNLNRQEQAAYDAIARNRTGIQNAYESDVAAAHADLDTQGLQAYINQMNADRAFGLQEAGLTGQYRGSPTLAAQNMQFNQALAEAGLTGQYQGQPTFDYQRWQADNEYRNKTFDENVRQFNLNYGLNLKQMDLNQAQRAIDNAYKQGQLSLAQAQQALAEAKFIYQQEQDSLDRTERQMESNTPKPIGTSDYKTSPDFAADVSTVLADPSGALKLIEANAAAFIEKYGYDGYRELLRLAEERGY